MKQAHWLVLTLFFTLHGVAQTITLYDNFDHKFLNPSRWAYALCYSGSGLEMECVREIRDERLHLAHHPSIRAVILQDGTRIVADERMDLWSGVSCRASLP